MSLEHLPAIIHALGLVLLYAILGFGPGVAAGVMFANFVAGRDKQKLREKHEDKTQEAIVHNAQWHPAHERWKKD